MAEESRPYDPLKHSVVQSLILNEATESFEASDFHEALLFAIAREIGRVHNNRYGSSWDRWSDDPHIPGIQWRRYASECGCPESSDGFIPRHTDECRAVQPNFQFESVRFRWYKNPGRGMSVSANLDEAQWVSWFNRCLAKIKEFDVKIGALENPLTPMPKPEHLHSARIDVLWLSAWSDYRSVIDEAISELTGNIRQVDSGSIGSDWAEILGPFPDSLTRAAVLAVACGIAAEKARAKHEDRPEAAR